MLLKMVGNNASYICFVVKEQKREIMSVVLSEKLLFFSKPTEFWFCLSNA